MLSVRHLNAFYGKSHVLHGVDFDIAPGEIVSLLGRNGSGRSTTARAIMGLVQASGDLRQQPFTPDIYHATPPDPLRSALCVQQRMELIERNLKRLGK